MCVSSYGGVACADVRYDVAASLRDARFMLENHLDKIDDVPLECKPAPKRDHSRTPRTTGRTRISRLVVHFEQKHCTL